MGPSLLQQLYTPLIFFFIALVSRAIFAFLETSITALRLFRLKELASEMKGRYATLFQTLEQQPHRVLVTTLIASNLSDVTVAALATQMVEMVFEYFHLSSGLGFSVGIGVASIVLLIFGEILPKNLARGRGERIFKSMLWLINLVYLVLSPLASLLTRFSDAIVSRTGAKGMFQGSSEWVASEREVQFLINYIHKQGLMETEKTEMLKSIFELGSTPIKEIMVPATDIVSVSIETPIKEALHTFTESRFTRLPAYESSTDNIVGMVHQKDIMWLLCNNETRTIAEIMRPILFVPDSMKVNQLLREFRQKSMHIAIVLNEHGIVTGLITLEDVLEEIVGEISDEDEPSTEKIVPLQHGGWLADASVPLEDLEEVLGIVFEVEDAVTLGGFLTEQLQHMPQKGERLDYKDHCFQIQRATPRRVQQVLIFEKKRTEK